jgi:hypothetical protein
MFFGVEDDKKNLYFFKFDKVKLDVNSSFEFFFLITIVIESEVEIKLIL